MEVKEAIEFIEDSYTYLYVDLHGNKEEVKKFGEIVDLLKSLEAENKALKILKQAQKDEDKKECIRYQTMYRLKRENKKLKQENKALRKDKWELEGINEACRRENEAYREMWKELKPTDDYECLILEERHLLSKMGNLENKYLGGGE